MVDKTNPLTQLQPPPQARFLVQDPHPRRPQLLRLVQRPGGGVPLVHRPVLRVHPRPHALHGAFVSGARRGGYDRSLNGGAAPQASARESAVPLRALSLPVQSSPLPPACLSGLAPAHVPALRPPSPQVPVIQLLLGGLGLISSTQMFSIWRYVVVRKTGRVCRSREPPLLRLRAPWHRSWSSRGCTVCSRPRSALTGSPCPVAGFPQVGSTVAAAVLTPSTDPLTQGLLALPLMGERALLFFRARVLVSTDVGCSCADGYRSSPGLFVSCRALLWRGGGACCVRERTG